MDTPSTQQTILESPGHEVQRLLEVRNVSQSDFADIVGYSEKQVSQILTGSSPLTMDFALRLERTLGGLASEWMQKEMAFRLAIEKEKQEKDLRRIQMRNDIYERMPVREMVKLGWIPDPGRDTGKLVASVKSFWGMKDWDFSFMEQSPAMLMRSSEAYQAKFNPNFAATWLRKASVEAERIPTPAPFDPNAVEKFGFDLPAYSASPDGETAALRRLGQIGVKVLELPHLPQTYLDGAAFMSGGSPTIVFTRRLDRIDNFWFVLAHETAHVCLHLRKETNETHVFLDCDEPASNQREDEANALAGRFLRHREMRSFFRNCPRISREAVLEYSKRNDVNPGIVVGFLQHIHFLTYWNFNDLKSRKPTADSRKTRPHPVRSKKTDGGRRTARMR